MTGNTNKSTVAIFLGAGLVALYVVSSVFMTEGNRLGNLFFYIMLGCGMVGLVTPKAAFLLFILECGYLDLVKRLMVLEGKVNYIDLFWVLGIAPVTLAGITCGIVLQMIFGGFSSRKSDWQRLITLSTINILVAIFLISKGNGIGKTLNEVANYPLYMLLMFVVPALFRSPESITKTIRHIILIFLPVAFYGIYQSINGFQQFEIDYLRSGLSIEIKQLFETTIRPFSTLNSPTAFACVSAILAAVCYFIAPQKNEKGHSIFTPPIAYTLSLIFFVALIISTGRTDLMIPPLVLAGCWTFKHRRRTILFYGVSIALFISLVISSPWLLTNLDTWNRLINNNFSSGSWISLILSIGTYSDRLLGFQGVLLNPNAYNLLGVTDNSHEQYYYHDPVSSILLNYGVLGLICSLTITVISVSILHKKVWRVQSHYLRHLCAASLSLFIAVIAVSLLSGSRINIFPINIFFWLFFSINLALYEYNTQANKQTGELLKGQQPNKKLGVIANKKFRRFKPVPKSLI